jgi:hypothetical protein
MDRVCVSCKTLKLPSQESHYICELNYKVGSYVYVYRDSSVGIATGYGLDAQGGREFESR